MRFPAKAFGSIERLSNRKRRLASFVCLLSAFAVLRTIAYGDLRLRVHTVEVREESPVPKVSAKAPAGKLGYAENLSPANGALRDPTAIQSIEKKREVLCASPEHLGDDYGGWTICDGAAISGQLVYTIGVGRNIEWDKAMISKFGTQHHGWDPTPSAKGFFEKNPPPPGLHLSSVWPRSQGR